MTFRNVQNPMHNFITSTQRRPARRVKREKLNHHGVQPRVERRVAEQNSPRTQTIVRDHHEKNKLEHSQRVNVKRTRTNEFIPRMFWDAAAAQQNELDSFRAQNTSCMLESSTIMTQTFENGHFCHFPCSSRSNQVLRSWNKHPVEELSLSRFPGCEKSWRTT